jgi:hypothetical protein
MIGVISFCSKLSSVPEYTSGFVLRVRDSCQRVVLVNFPRTPAYLGPAVTTAYRVAANNVEVNHGVGADGRHFAARFGRYD